jgi:glycosyltransferase involved in cell wall biosynthesis
MRVKVRNGLTQSDNVANTCQVKQEAARKEEQWKREFGDFSSPRLGDWDAPTVSVVMPVYNYGDRLERAAESVACQSYPHWELVLVDDGSTDDSWETICQIAEQYPGRVNVVKQPNMGLSVARNSGIRVSDGDYICLLDPDDMYREDKLLRQVEFMSEHPYIGMCYSNAMLHANGQEHATNCPDFDRNLLLRANIIPCQSVMIRRAVFDIVGLFNEAMEEVEDYEYWVRVAEHFGISRIQDLIAYDIFQHSGQKSVKAQKQRPEQWRDLHKRINQWGSYRKSNERPLVSVVTQDECTMVSARLQTLPNVECVKPADDYSGLFVVNINEGWRFSSPHDLSYMMWDIRGTVKEVKDSTGRITLHRNPQVVMDSRMPLAIRITEEASASKGDCP